VFLLKKGLEEARKGGAGKYIPTIVISFWALLLSFLPQRKINGIEATSLFIKEYIIVIIVSIGMFFLFSLLNKYKNPKYRLIASIIGILLFVAMLTYEIIKKKGVNNTGTLVSFFLVVTLVMFLTLQALRNYRQLKSR
jgi:hypothetical protein